MMTKKEKAALKVCIDRLLKGNDKLSHDWKKTWKNFIKYDYPYGNIIELNIFKLTQIREYMDNHTTYWREEANKDIKELDKVINLGYKIIEYDYIEEAMQWFEHFSTPIAIIYNKKDRKKVIGKLQGVDFIDDSSVDIWLKENNLSRNDVIVSYTREWDNESLDNDHKFQELLNYCLKNRHKDIDNFFKLIAKNIDSWGD